jgi:hypothetical protein
MSDAAKLADEIERAIRENCYTSHDDPETVHGVVDAVDAILALRSLPREAELRRAQEKLAFEICESLCEQMDAGENETRRLAAKVMASERVKTALRAALSSEGQEKKSQSSDGGDEVGSSPVLASKEDQRDCQHGVMPVGDKAEMTDRTGASPSEALALHEGERELAELADEIESSHGLVKMVVGSTVQLGIKKTAQVIAALRRCSPHGDQSNSDGGVEGHAGRGAGGANSPVLNASADAEHTGIKLIAGIKPGPSETEWSKRLGIKCAYPDGADRCAGCRHYHDPKQYPECDWTVSHIPPDKEQVFDFAASAIAAQKIFDCMDNNLSKWDAVGEGTPQGAVELYETAKQLSYLLEKHRPAAPDTEGR